MHVCLICIELFGDGIYGGFGRATRFIGRELVRRGVVVTVAVPRRSEHFPDSYELDGMTVRQYRADRPWTALKIFSSCGADVFHSQDASMGTVLARLAAPRARHIVTLRDPLESHDWKLETHYSAQPSVGWWQYRRFIDNPMVVAAVKNSHALYCAAEFLQAKAVRKYGLKTRPEFLPSPVDVPAMVSKSDRPTVCFVGRWERRKRPELFFELARNFPQVDFIAVGGTRDQDEDRRLRAAYSEIPNLRMTGMLDQFVSGELSEVMGQSWILVNCSPREGLPTTFIEAAAHRCAILSFSDPDGFTSKFGQVAEEGGLNAGLASLLAADRWRECGERGFRYVNGIFATPTAMDAHMAAYKRVLDRRNDVVK